MVLAATSSVSVVPVIGWLFLQELISVQCCRDRALKGVGKIGDLLLGRKVKSR
jgi:hypothetical protein